MALPDDRIKQLEFIQTTISRQASHSFAIKGWAITVATAAYAYTAANLNCWIALISLVPPIAFGWLDSYYLRQERLFRALYDDAIQPDSDVPLLSMNTAKYTDHATYPYCQHRKVIWSNTWKYLYVPLIAIGLILFGVAVVECSCVQVATDFVRNRF